VLEAFIETFGFSYVCFKFLTTGILQTLTISTVLPLLLSLSHGITTANVSVTVILWQ